MTEPTSSNKKTYIALASSITVLLLLIVIFMATQSEPENTGRKQTTVSKKPEKEKQHKKSSVPEEKKERKPEPPKKDESPEPKKKELAPHEKFKRAVRKARNTNCPLVVLYYNEKKPSRKTLRNLQDPRVQKVLSHIHLLKRKTQKDVIEINNQMHGVPFLIAYEPWATNVLRSRANRDRNRDNERRLIQSWNQQEDKERATVNATNQPVQNILSSLSDQLSIPFVYKDFGKRKYEKRRMSMVGQQMSLEDVLNKIRKNPDFTYIVSSYTNTRDETYPVVNVYAIPERKPEQKKKKTEKREQKKDPLRLTGRNLLRKKVAELNSEIQKNSPLRKKMMKQLENAKVTFTKSNLTGKDMLDEISVRSNQIMDISDPALQRIKGFKVSVNFKDTSAMMALNFLTRRTRTGFDLSGGTLKIRTKNELKSDTRALSVSELLIFLRKKVCREPETVDSRKKKQIEDALKNLRSKDSTTREAAEHYLESLKLPYRSFLRRKLRESSSRKDRETLGRILTGTENESSHILRHSIQNQFKWKSSTPPGNED